MSWSTRLRRRSLDVSQGRRLDAAQDGGDRRGSATPMLPRCRSSSRRRAPTASSASLSPREPRSPDPSSRDRLLRRRHRNAGRPHGRHLHHRNPHQRPAPCSPCRLLARAAVPRSVTVVGSGVRARSHARPSEPDSIGIEVVQIVGLDRVMVATLTEELPAIAGSRPRRADSIEEGRRTADRRRLRLLATGRRARSRASRRPRRTHRTRLRRRRRRATR